MASGFKSLLSYIERRHAELAGADLGNAGLRYRCPRGSGNEDCPDLVDGSRQRDRRPPVGI